MKKGIWVCIVLLIVLLGAAVAYFYFRPTKVTSSFSCAALQHKPIIAAFGDSLIFGYGAENQHGFIGPLSQKTGIPILDNGVNGNTTAAALDRINDVLAEKPNIVLVLLGGNDALQQIPQSKTQANLEQILRTLQQNNIRVVLLGVLGGFPNDPYLAMFQSLASNFSVRYIPNVLDGLIGNDKYMYDQVHPNAAGYDIIAQKAYPVLNQACADFAK